jgi:GT2 family glycosyltransferase
VIVALTATFGSDPTRLAHQAFVERYYRVVWDVPVVFGTDEVDAEGRYGRARAVNNAAREAARRYPAARSFILCDNDMIPCERALDRALREHERYAAVRPHANLIDLTESSTRHYKATGEVREHTLRGWPNLSYLVLTRDAFALVNGLDERFRGWGAEDNAFYYALRTQVGPILELSGHAVHLWHAVDATKRDDANLARNRARAKAYHRATPAASRRLSREYGALGL